MRDSSIICVGYSRLPEGMTGYKLYGSMGVGLEIDVKTNKIINATATFVTSMCTSFLCDIFKGHDVNQGIEEPIKKFEEKYYGMGKKAIIAAVNDAYNQYLMYKESTK